ncbi:MAG: metalloregulator ArsR/SmtB family transcription factor [Pseudomonadota bacterium]
MANESTDTLSPLLAALADPTRRAVVEALSRGPAPVSDLAAPYDMALPSFLKHLDKLEKAGVVTSHKQGRVRICRLRNGGLKPMQDWLAREERRWARSLDRLAAHLDTLEKDPKQ